jgi:imidazolonepropionase-like amidohydrolase
MRASNMALIPTLTLFHEEAKKGNASQEDTAGLLKLIVEQLRAYASAGGQILFGTDVGYIDQVDTSEEFDLMSHAGMDFKQILAALTTNPAQRFGFDQRSGRLLSGFEGDIVVLDGDPAQDARAFARVRYTIRAGKLIYKNR